MPKYLINGYQPGNDGEPVAAPTREAAIERFRTKVPVPDGWVVQANQIL